MSDIAISVENLGKRYRIGAKENAPTNWKEAAANLVGSPFNYLRSMLKEPPPAEIIWAIKNISFEVKQGEVVGIVGRNGAGKSTLLRILTRITEPTEGQARLQGRVGSLLEVGTGFHPELTGRENVFINAAILGMKKHEIKRKFDEIVDFSGVEKFIDTPVKRYSSGMRIRLGFAVAAYLEPEILLIDEVLAVGDAEFQKKCLGKMDEVASHGRTVLFVSHNMESIISLCPRTIWLEQGKIKGEGPSKKIVHEYLSSTKKFVETTKLSERTDRSGNGQLRFTDFYLRNEKGNMVKTVACGDYVEFVASFVTTSEILSNVNIVFGIFDELDRSLITFNSRLIGKQFKHLPSKGDLVCQVPRFCLSPGEYSLRNLSANADKILDSITEVLTFEAVSGDFYGSGQLPHHSIKGGVFLSEFCWKLNNTS